MKFIVVEDDSLTALFLSETLEELGHEVLGSFDNAKECFEFVQTRDVDIALMDIEIKGDVDGIHCAYKLNTKYNIRSIFVTSYQNTSTIDDAMDTEPLGYIIKPVSVPDIVAAISLAKQALKTSLSSNLYKAKEDTNQNIVVGDYKYSKKHKVLTYKGELVKLGSKESELLELLFINFGLTVENDVIKQTIWDDVEITDDTLRQLIFRLRKKIPNVQLISFPRDGYCIKLF